jgi:hypothetical protein
MQPTNNIEGIWSEIVSQHEARSSHLVAELRAAWQSLDEIVEHQAKRFPPDRRWTWPEEAPRALAQLFDETADELLEQAVSSYGVARPQRRALKAMHEYQASLEQLVRASPAELLVAPSELVKVFDPKSKSSLRGRWAQRLSKEKPLPMRDILVHHLRDETDELAALNGKFLLALAKGCLTLIEPWETVRREALKRLEGTRFETGPYRRQADRWLRRISANRRAAVRALAGFDAWRGGCRSRLEQALLAGRTHAAVPAELPLGQLPFAAYWSRRRQAISAQVNLESQFVALGRATIRRNLGALASMESERREAIDELSGVENWLENWKTDTGASFPRPELSVTSAKNRSADWASDLVECAKQHLPATIEVGEPRGVFPGWRDPWKTLHAQQLFKRSMFEAGEPLFLSAAYEVEAAHAGVLIEFERVREVVAFGMETAESDGDLGNQMASEVVDNLLASVRHLMEATQALSADVPRNVTAAAAAAFSHAYLVAEQGRLGVARHLARQGFVRSLQGLRRSGKLTAEWGEERAKAIYRRLLEGIGWEYARDRKVERVRRREYLSEELNVDLREKELPLIYQRLFRLEPVDDARFLVGRDLELSALQEVRDRWLRGRSVAVLMTGERGSGKTSLLNCGIAQVFSDCEVVRGNFDTRIRTAEELQSFLRNRLSLAPDADLRQALTERKRVIAFEETERCFLRESGGFDGIRELLTLVSDTYQSTLWILSMNVVAFELLDATVGMGKCFSHRINAMAVDASDLESAIRLRHNFSGLRLQFSEIAVRNDIRNKLQRLAGLEDSPDEIFFDSIYQLSGGVFRSAFELWQAQIERSEAGILHMKYPQPPNYAPLLKAIDHDDTFTLHAILQHGSITAAEHAAIFRTTEAESMRRLDHLIDREILQQDPHFGGFRVRPAAGNFVRMALHGQNLI